MSANAAGLTGGQATLALARLALVRAVRGKALWIAMALSLFPLLIVGVRVGLGHDRIQVWRVAFELTLITLPIVPSILIGPSLSDELEEKTSAYLWSRALPRWSIIAGKLLGLAPIAALIAVGALTISWMVLGGPASVSADLAARGLAGVGFAALVASALVAALATLVPRHAVAVSVVYLLFIDAFVGALPLKIQHISISFGARSIAGFADPGLVGGAVALAIIAVVGVTIAVTRIARME